MFIEGFIWLPEIIDKLISKHQITPQEVEDIFFNRPRFRFHEKGRVQGENMYTAIGQADGGRYLVVFFILKSSHRALIVSARDSNRSERKYYERKK